MIQRLAVLLLLGCGASQCVTAVAGELGLQARDTEIASASLGNADVQQTPDIRETMSPPPESQAGPATAGKSNDARTRAVARVLPLLMTGGTNRPFPSVPQ
jgi:hypothetical protein